MDKSVTAKSLMSLGKRCKEHSNVGILIILAGPTAAGKSIIQKELLRQNQTLHKVITYTTRPLRNGERDGIDYHFVNKEQFEERLSQGLFIESDCYNGEYYGTPKNQLDPIFSGNDVVWILTMPRALDIDTYIKDTFDLDTARAIISQTVTILVVPESIDQLKKQFIMKRGGSQREFSSRIPLDCKFSEENKERFDYVIYNQTDKLTKAIDQVQKIIRSRHTLEVDKIKGVL